MEKWNRNDYQGRRKDQVDYSNKAGFISGVVFVSLIIILTIVKLLN
tara:strand:+ start:4168 stop:4305 length:138 start_codon:yes stop_codon:yes gene_type:complete